MDNTNRVFYRVVAIDENGTESGSSDYAEAPHPFIYTLPPADATVGQAYTYQVKSLHSIGNLQMKDGKYDYYDVEVDTFGLNQGPAWLTIQSDTGVLTGTPGSADVGETTVSLEVCNQFGECDSQQFPLTVSNH